MIRLRKSTEDEMICEYLKAEYQSQRFSTKLKEVMGDMSLEEHLLLSPDQGSLIENMQRKALLGEYRGYGLNREMFERFPTDIEWSLCEFSREDLTKIRYIDYCYWNELSTGTHSPCIAAEKICAGIFVYDIPNDGFLHAAEYIRAGGCFPKMIFLTSEFEEFVIVEGHLRMTAFALAPEFFQGIEVIVGKCKEEDLKNWM